MKSRFGAFSALARTSALAPAGVIFVLSLLAALPAGLAAQDEIGPDQLIRVFPTAQRFGDREGQPPVYRAYATDPAGGETHVGFVFLTSDIPPETTGYSAPIRVLVGMDLTGQLTGIRVISYRESLRSSRGDFLTRAGVQGQFAGKRITEAFRVRQDVETITGATMTVNAMAVGVRNAARRVAAAYMMGPALAAGAPVPRLGTISLEDLDRLTWPEIVRLGLANEITADVGGSDLLRVSIAYLRDEAMAEAIVGTTRFPDAIAKIKERSPGHMIFVGLNGPQIIFFRPEQISFSQGGNTITVVQPDFISTGLLPNGKAGGEFRRTGILRVDPALDVRQPFTVNVNLGDQTVSGDYRAFDDAPVVAAAGGSASGAGDSAVAVADAGTAIAGSAAPGAAGLEAADAAGSVTAGTAGTNALAQATPEPSATLPFDFTEQELSDFLLTEEEEETALARTLSQMSWPRVIGLLVLLTLVTWAFVAKNVTLRWVALAGTVAFLGFVDRGFLSVSHILSGISVGPSVYLGDVSLLILVAFTVVTTLFWGRVFCGYLCPFGALQDILERVVPRRFRRELPQGIHDKALYAKYGVLGVTLAPAIFGASFTIYHFVEPFGTVFFWSPSVLLWTIAIGILVASAIVPRFYCRYMCPLGAALAIGSLLAPFRIRRVEQCTVCKVCERKCPTGAIRGHEIDFKECVRCNVCEIQLIEQTGACKHDMEVIRPRLVQLRAAQSRSAV